MSAWVDAIAALIAAHPHWAGVFVCLVAACDAVVVIGYFVAGTDIVSSVGDIAGMPPGRVHAPDIVSAMSRPPVHTVTGVQVGALPGFLHLVSARPACHACSIIDHHAVPRALSASRTPLDLLRITPGVVRR